MTNAATSIRPFLGAKDYDLSRRFYQTLGFDEVILSDTMSLFRNDVLGFYLQRAYVKDWVDNTMVFLEVRDIDAYWQTLSALNLPAAYEGVRLSAVQAFDWGNACYLHDPSGILWHIGQFSSR
ncbi:glyoxalase [Spirosoma luteolum]